MPHFEHPARPQPRPTQLVAPGACWPDDGLRQFVKERAKRPQPRTAGNLATATGQGSRAHSRSASVPCRPPTAEVFWSGNLPPQAPSGDALPCRRRLLVRPMVRRPQQRVDLPHSLVQRSSETDSRPQPPPPRLTSSPTCASVPTSRAAPAWALRRSARPSSAMPPRRAAASSASTSRWKAAASGTAPSSQRRWPTAGRGAPCWSSPSSTVWPATSTSSPG